MSPKSTSPCGVCNDHVTDTLGMACSRRCALVTMLHLTLAVTVVGCGADAGAPTANDAVTVDGTSIRVRLDRIDALRIVGAAYVIGELSVIVLRVAANEFRAFSNVCTHTGCGIFVFQNARMLCQCHGSEFDLDGQPVAGPAARPLAQYRADVDAAGTTLTILRTT